MIVIDNGRMLSDAETVNLADDMNFFARGGREANLITPQHGPLSVEPTDPFQHSGRATYFTMEDAAAHWDIAGVPPQDGVAVFTLDRQGNPIVRTVGGGEEYVNWVRDTAYIEDVSLLPWATPGSSPSRDYSNSVASYERLIRQLRYQDAASVFTREGMLHPDAVRTASRIPLGSELSNPEVVRELTSNGTRIQDWGKYATRTSHSPSGDFQVHFYYNPTTGEVNYNIDYRVVFNRPVGGRR